MPNLVTSENLLRLITENLPDLLWIKDLEGNYIYANDATAKILLNTVPENLIGKDDLYFIKKLDHFVEIDFYYDSLEELSFEDIEKINKEG